MQQKSLISEYFNGKSVFITGVTGFIGKVLLEKLLRSCPGIDKIYVLIREKKGLLVSERLDKVLEAKLFSFCLDVDTIRKKVVAIDGDLSVEGMGLKESDRQLLVQKVAIVFHVAGDVKFNETIRDAVTNNLIGTKYITQLCRQCLALEALVHVSTAYAFCQHSDLEERIYPMTVSPEEVINAVETMNDKELTRYTEPLLEGRPNCYTFAKALAEHIVHRDRPDRLPVAIVRPSIVLPTYQDPTPGWIDCFNGATGIGVVGSLGIMRIADYDGQKHTSFIPADMIANALVAAAWHLVATRPTDVQIYHLASEPHNTPAVGKIIAAFVLAQQDSPSIKVVRPHAGIPQYRPSRLRVWLTVMVSHLMFAYLVDAIIWLLGHKPILVSVTNRMHNGFEMLSYFWMKEWTFRSQNTRSLLDWLAQRSPKDFNDYPFDVGAGIY
ncbi:putative fatty acyl-CoA reductase CG5065 [Oppia nitens]|uniref:putative fatty acyl-CoA reductase CG5065 n=1 Tax=Oppia nitens TaxID=1686743 RepID=UPI0023DB11BF|nr:putative fatty acyl-CoA reductase CG5065 [Oppia nitens]